MRVQYMMLCLFVAMMGACIPKKDARQAEEASREGRWGEAYRLWSEVLEEKPGDAKARVKKERARLNAGLYHLQRGSLYYERAQYPEAEFELKLAIGYDPQNQEADRLLKTVKAEKLRLEQETAESVEKQFSSNLPKLRPTTWAPQDLSFINQSVKDIYQSMGQAYGVNIVVDSKIRNDKVTLDLRNLSFLKALDTLMVVNRHFFKVIDDNTIIIMEDNKNNRDRYDNEIIQTFYLSNITPSDLKNHLRVLLNIKEFAENEKLNAITIKGTPEQIALAEKMIATNDKAQPEVVVEIELLEVNKSQMRRVGMMPINPSDGSPAYQVGLLADPAGRSQDEESANAIRGFFPSLDSEDILTIVPAVVIDFLKENGGSTQVANPHLRVTSGEQGSVRIGQSIPILQTSFTNPNISGSASGGNNFGDQALATFNYNDVGIRVEVKPRVHFNNEVTLTLDMEVLSVISGGFQPTLGRRQVTTTLRLKNGETNVIAGLLTNDERKSLAGIVGLSSIPIIGRLFSNDEKIVSQTDIIMTIRPVIVRGVNVNDEDRAAYELSNLTLSTLYGHDAAKSQAPGAISSAPAASASSPSKTSREPRRAFDGNFPEGPEEEVVEESDPFEEENQEPPPAMLSFAPISEEGRQDDLMEFQLFVTNVEGMKRGQIALEFDPAVLRCESVEVGDFFNAGSKLPLMTPDWNNRTGRIAMVITQRASSGGFSGSGIMAIVRMRGKAPGSGALNFATIKLINQDGEEIPVQGLPANYEVYP